MARDSVGVAPEPLEQPRRQRPSRSAQSSSRSCDESGPKGTDASAMRRSRSVVADGPRPGSAASSATTGTWRWWRMSVESARSESWSAHWASSTTTSTVSVPARSTSRRATAKASSPSRDRRSSPSSWPTIACGQSLSHSTPDAARTRPGAAAAASPSSRDLPLPASPVTRTALRPCSTTSSRARRTSWRSCVPRSTLSRARVSMGRRSSSPISGGSAIAMSPWSRQPRSPPATGSTVPVM